eukprot:scaffold1821_cov344-Pavlova_lutheri.AAC.39
MLAGPTLEGDGHVGTFTWILLNPIRLSSYARCVAERRFVLSTDVGRQFRWCRSTLKPPTKDIEIYTDISIAFPGKILRDRHAPIEGIDR